MSNLKEQVASLVDIAGQATDENRQHVKTKSFAPKRWRYLIPLIFITYSLAYLDRANYGFASAAGIEQDLGITKSMSSLIGALFFLGYFFFQVPGAIYAQKYSVRKLVFWSLILWGICAMATGLVTNIPMLMVIRVSLGIVEAAVMPAMLIFISNWFTRKERSRANTFLVLGNPVTVLWMSVVSGYLIHAWGWREMFVIEGAPAVLWAFIWWRLARDKPEQVDWLTQQEKNQLAATLANEQKGMKVVRNYRQAFTSPVVIQLCCVHALWSIGVYGFIMWLPTIIKQAAATDIVTVGWLSAVPYVAAVAAMLAVSWMSDKSQQRKHFVWPLLALGALAFFCSYLLGPSHFWLSFALLSIAGAALYAPYGPFFALIPEVLPSNVFGGAIGLINACGALGAFVGSWIVGYLIGLTGNPGAAYIFMTVGVLSSALLMAWVKVRR
ncbi:MFS transporter [Pseudomonas veronii]|jgi:sugar phosphate permease|uniref:MFS transporter n=1 Tax=Pseudomonas veronii TaxID=76761 RepID=UPI0014742D43|nr:MFS transporter [Pseudomonas veronii]MCT8960880.1 MFS transporter [Pseudomonas veronii]NMX51045.1 MFS transporter [Pseudomonas veronii]